MWELRDPDSKEHVADWVELLIEMGEPTVSRTKVSGIVESNLGRDPGETFLCDVWRELERRQGRYINARFSVSGQEVLRLDDQPCRVEYVACLLLSLYGGETDWPGYSKLFERLTAEALREYLNGEVYLFGWPVTKGQSSSIAERMHDLAQRCGELFVVAPAAQYKDRGVDVIGWRCVTESGPTPRRSGKLVILLQCAAGLNWAHKALELPFDSWRQYFRWACEPLRAFAVPAIISDEAWHEKSREGGILFDRIRLLNLLPKGVQDDALRDTLQQFIEFQLNEVAA